MPAVSEIDEKEFTKLVKKVLFRGTHNQFRINNYILPLQKNNGGYLYCKPDGRTEFRLDPPPLSEPAPTPPTPAPALPAPTPPLPEPEPVKREYADLGFYDNVDFTTFEKSRVPVVVNGIYGSAFNNKFHLKDKTGIIYTGLKDKKVFKLSLSASLSKKNEIEDRVKIEVYKNGQPIMRGCESYIAVNGTIPTSTYCSGLVKIFVLDYFQVYITNLDTNDPILVNNLELNIIQVE
jgi:hypothetical protein